MLLFWLLACQPEPEPVDPTCTSMCRELVETCALATYPDNASCLDGCSYAKQEGADIEQYAFCVSKAACDPFFLVTCEHSYGLD